MKIAIFGLGYVGLPLAVELSKHYMVIGYDKSEHRIAELRSGHDTTLEVESYKINESSVVFTDDLTVVKNHECDVYIVAVPTDVNADKSPNLNPLILASSNVAFAMKKGSIVIYESTVYPGCTEEICVPALAARKGYTPNVDFFYGYSPERIVPGDTNRTLTDVVKIVSGSTPEALQIISDIYSKIVKAGIYEAPSIKIAEAAKVVENVQRDLNISLMNELSMIFNRIGISTQEVLKAAGTKWNFHHYYPGLVGGHCIGVDPHYLMHKARQVGYEPQVILSGRSVNDAMPAWIAKRIVQALLQSGKNPVNARVLVMGITFKENVTDIRNSKVIDLITELKDYGITVDVTDPYARPEQVKNHYGITINTNTTEKYDVVVFAVAHDVFKVQTSDVGFYSKTLVDDGLVVDIKGNCKVPDNYKYISL